MQQIGGLANERLQEVACQDQHKVVKTEEDVVPARTVPDAVAQPHGQQRYDGLDHRPHMAAELLTGLFTHVLDPLGQRQRIEDVILEPGAQRNVPPAPKFRGGTGEKGLTEVFRQTHAEHFRRTDGHVDTAGEIGIQLQGITDGAQQHRDAAVLCVFGEDQLYQRTEPIRQHHFFEKTPDDALGTERNVVVGQTFTGIQRLRRFGIAADGAFHNGGKKRHIQRQTPQIPVGGDLLFVYIHDVGHRLHGEKGDADGHRQLQRGEGEGQRHLGEQNVQIAADKVEILQKQQHTDLHRHTQPQNPPFFPDGQLLLGVKILRAPESFQVTVAGVQPQTHVMHTAGGEQQIDDELPAQQEKEHIAGRQQQLPAVLLGQQLIEQHDNRQKYQQI